MCDDMTATSAQLETSRCRSLFLLPRNEAAAVGTLEIGVKQFKKNQQA